LVQSLDYGKDFKFWFPASPNQLKFQSFKYLLIPFHLPLWSILENHQQSSMKITLYKCIWFFSSDNILLTCCSMWDSFSDWDLVVWNNTQFSRSFQSQPLIIDRAVEIIIIIKLIYTIPATRFRSDDSDLKQYDITVWIWIAWNHVPYIFFCDLLLTLSVLNINLTITN
jgi:hypothetical protein